MSDCVINLRVLWWSFQYTTYGRFRFGFNRWLWQNERYRAMLKPIALYEWDWSKRNTESLGR
jgi:hypothetical protein